MKKLFTAGAMAAALAAALPASAALVTFTPASQHIEIGDTVVVDVTISGLGTEVLTAVDMNMMFSSGAASNTAHDFSSLETELGGSDSYLENDVLTPLEVGILAWSWLETDDQVADIQTNGGFLLGTLTFQGAFNGVTMLGLGADLDYQRNFVGRAFQTLPISVEGACIAVGTGSCDNTVPEPSSYGLAAIALLAAGAAGRSRRRKTLA